MTAVDVEWLRKYHFLLASIPVQNCRAMCPAWPRVAQHALETCVQNCVRHVPKARATMPRRARAGELPRCSRGTAETHTRICQELCALFPRHVHGTARAMSYRHGLCRSACKVAETRAIGCRDARTRLLTGDLRAGLPRYVRDCEDMYAGTPTVVCKIAETWAHTY